MKRTPRGKTIEKQTGAPQTPEERPRFVQDWTDLAAQLHVSRRAIQEWRKDPRYAAACPPDRADGRKEVAAWLAFMVQFGLKRADRMIDLGAEDDDEEDPEAGPVIRPPRIGGAAAEWAKADSWKKFQKREIEVDQLKGVLLEAADLEVPIGATFATIQGKLSQFPARVARYLVGLRDVAELEERLRDEIDADLSEINATRYTAASAIADAIAALPFDAETERLIGLVAFEGQDRSTLLALIAAVATEALRQLGRRAIQACARIDEEADGADSSGLEDDCGKTASPDVEPSAAAGGKEETASSNSRGGRRLRKSRPKPAAPPGEVETAMREAPKRRRRK